MASQVVQVVVSCTERKLRAAPPSLQLRSYQYDLPARADAWMARLASPETEPVPASSMYRGEHWSVAGGLPEAGLSVRQQVRLSIASAGYGLVDPEEAVEPYAATFTPRHQDSITRIGSSSDSSSDARYWWNRLANRKRPDHLPATLMALAQQSPDAPLLIALSGIYARAVADDLLQATEVLSHSDHLYLISAGASDHRLEPLRVPVDARFSQALGGTTLSLNVRVAKYLIEQAPEHAWERDAVHDLLQSELSQLPPRRRYERRQLTDEEVMAFIDQHLKARSGLSRTGLLRLMRDQDLACEQKRFGLLYEAVRDGART